MVRIAGSRMSTKLPVEDHVVRYVPKPRLRRDEDGNVIGVLPQAFERREDEDYLSVTWLEHFCSEYEAGLRAASAAIRRQLKVKPRDGFTVGNVGKIVEVCESVEVRIRLLHEEEPENARCHTWHTARSLRAVRAASCRRLYGYADRRCHLPMK
jgi:hypothetical protein